jgi:hypothetical protein
VSGNTSRRQPLDPDEDSLSLWIGLLIGTTIDKNGRPEPGWAAGYFISSEDVSLAVSKHAAFFADQRTLPAITVDTNVVGGGGGQPAVLVAAPAEVVFTGNHCQQRTDTEAAALHLVASAATVSANRLRGGKPSGQLVVDPLRLAVLGNLSSTGILMSGNVLGLPWQPLNLEGV